MKLFINMIFLLFTIQSVGQNDSLKTNAGTCLAPCGTTDSALVIRAGSARTIRVGQAKPRGMETMSYSYFGDYYGPFDTVYVYPKKCAHNDGIFDNARPLRLVTYKIPSLKKTIRTSQKEPQMKTSL